MRCLMCGKEMGGGGLRDIIIGDDELCQECRSMWIKKRLAFVFEGVQATASYVYNDAFSSCLIQYKELCDEALRDVFLHEEKQWLKRRYKGYAICLMPSSLSKRKERGFDHLEGIFGCLGMKMLSPFEKHSEASQKKLSSKERLAMSEAIILKPDVVLPRKILLCDDTITTGSTIKGALRQIDCVKHCVKIYCVSANKSWHGIKTLSSQYQNGLNRSEKKR